MKLLIRTLGLLIVTSQLFLQAVCKKNSSYPSSQPPPPPPPPVVDTTVKTPGLQLIADSMIAPLVITEPPDGSKRLFIADETGTIWIIGADGKKITSPFIDISARMVTLSSSYDERGLLGMAFHPDFKTNGKFYLFYTAPPNAGTPVPG